LELIKELNLKNYEIIAEKFYSGAISDILDDMGYRNQALDPSIRPIDSRLKVVGKAMTMMAIDVFEIPEECYVLELKAMDQIKEGEVIVVSTNFSKRTCFWGELLTTASIVKGARGAVMDSYTRDAKKILEVGFPLFTTGFSPIDSAGRSEVINYNCHIEIGGVSINPGDLVFGDIDGVVIVPSCIAVEVLNKAYNKIIGENKVREALLGGMNVSDAYNKYHIL